MTIIATFDIFWVLNLRKNYDVNITLALHNKPKPLQGSQSKGKARQVKL